MSALNRYKAAKREAEESAGWAALLGQSYRGGGGGTGHLVSLKLVGGEAAPTIYHQYSDSAKNYHQCPHALLPHLEAAAKSMFPMILEVAIKRQAEALQELAKDAREEHAALMLDAGLSLPTSAA